MPAAFVAGLTVRKTPMQYHISKVIYDHKRAKIQITK